MQFLIEDYTKGEQRYFSFLIDIHDEIIKKMKNKKWEQIVYLSIIANYNDILIIDL